MVLVYMNYLYLLIAFILVIFLYNMLDLKEGMSNNGETSCSTQSIMFQNQGAISNLQKQMDKIMEQLTKTNNTDASQSALLNSMNTKLGSIETKANDADTLSKQNQQRLLKMVKTQQQKYNNFSEKASKLPALK